MSQDTLHAMPSRSELASLDPEGFVLKIAEDEGVRVSLVEVRDGVPMNERYECYSLMIALPHDVQLPANVYHLFAGARQWLLLFTPIMPDADGRCVLEAVIHRDLQLAANTDA